MAKKSESGAIVLSALEEDILTVLFGNAKGVYGLDVLSRMNTANEKNQRRKIGVGSLYPTLKRLEQKGLVEGRWGDDTVAGEGSDGARRRYYTLTADGARALEATWQYREQLKCQIDDGCTAGGCLAYA